MSCCELCHVIPSQISRRVTIHLKRDISSQPGLRQEAVASYRGASKWFIVWIATDPGLCYEWHLTGKIQTKRLIHRVRVAGLMQKHLKIKNQFSRAKAHTYPGTTRG